MATIARPRYRKPDAICLVAPELEQLTSPDDIARFIASEKRRIEDLVSALGLRLRLATRDDIEAIHELQRRCFAPGTLVEDPYVLFRVIRFGYAPIAQAPDGRIVASNVCQGHDDPDRTAWGVRMTVDPSVLHHNLGAELVNYSILIGMERGSRLRRAFVAPTNYASVANALNHTGYIAEGLDVNVPGHQGPRFTIVLPLTPAGVKNNRIDAAKVRAFVKTHDAWQDYVIVSSTDIDGLLKVYAETSFRVVALLNRGVVSDDSAYLALPREVL